MAPEDGQQHPQKGGMKQEGKAAIPCLSAGATVS
jgi:hypothetical protein